MFTGHESRVQVNRLLIPIQTNEQTCKKKWWLKSIAVHLTVLTSFFTWCKVLLVGANYQLHTTERQARVNNLHCISWNFKNNLTKKDNQEKKLALSQKWTTSRFPLTFDIDHEDIWKEKGQLFCWFITWIEWRNRSEKTAWNLRSVKQQIWVIVT